MGHATLLPCSSFYVALMNNKLILYSYCLGLCNSYRYIYVIQSYVAMAIESKSNVFVIPVAERREMGLFIYQVVSTITVIQSI